MFNNILGQNKAISLLQQAVALNRIAPAYLFVGASGIGRSLVAKEFAQLLLNTTKQDSHPDLMWVEPSYSDRGELISVSEAFAQGIQRKSPPQIRIEQIRNIIQFLYRPPLQASRLVIVIEDAHTMAEAAANALLKTLEEPGKATLILIAPDTESLLATIVSRCQPIPFQRLSQEDLATVLQKTGHQEILEHPEIINMAQGSPGNAIAFWHTLQAIPESLLEQLKEIPNTSLKALELAKTIDQELDLPTQLWLVDYLQDYYWRQKYNPFTAKKWETTRKYLLSYVQPRLVWECALLRDEGLFDK